MQIVKMGRERIKEKKQNNIAGRQQRIQTIIVSTLYHQAYGLMD
jgi:hypothetical protein